MTTVEPAEGSAPNEVASRLRILSAAYELMSQHGYAATTISMVCKRSGLPPSSTYWHFGSKEGLLAAVIEDGARRWMEALPRWEASYGDPRKRVEELLQGVALGIKSDSTPMTLLLLLILERGDQISDETRDILRRVRASAASGIRMAYLSIFDDGTDEVSADAERWSRLILAAADGAVIAHKIDPSVELTTMFSALAQAMLASGDEHRRTHR